MLGSYPPGPLHIEAGRFLDTSGREVLLRGVNLGGDCKLPYPNGGTHVPSRFTDHRSVSFIGRPFPLGEADEHFGRLRHWGFNCLRLLTSWEAIEHAGPGQYDTAYLDYFTELCARAGHFGLYVYVDFHQDVWSRLTGGDGAPGWTLAAVGLDHTRLAAAGAAFVMQHEYDYADPRPRQPDNYPQMSWPSNYGLAANGILWTLFFGGRDFAPQFTIEGRNVQDYLQQHFFGAQAALAGRLAGLGHVIGFDLLNEPNAGWIGRPLSHRHTAATAEDPRPVLPGPAWSPLDCLAAGSGLPRAVPMMAISVLRRGVVTTGTRQMNPEGVSIWRDGAADPFAAAGAWRRNGAEAEALQEDYFHQRHGRQVDFTEDYLAPFYAAGAANLRRHNPDWLIFAEPDLLAGDPARAFPRHLPAATVNAGHCYDITTLLLKRHLYPLGVDLERGRLLAGRQAHLANYRERLQEIVAAGRPAGCATLIGEFGLPFDLAGGRAYRDDARHPGDARVWRRHVRALEICYEALDDLLLSATQWNYTASNRNDPAIGDGWNQEDLSIFSRDQQHDPTNPDSGGRAVDGFVRPYPRAVQGRLAGMHFDRRRGEFTLAFDADPALPAPSEIHVPARHFPHGYSLEAPGQEALRADGQCLQLRALQAGRLQVVLRRRPRGRAG